MQPDAPSSCTDTGWKWPGVAQYLPPLAPQLAPRNPARDIGSGGVVEGPSGTSAPGGCLRACRVGRLRGGREYAGNCSQLRGYCR
jgi:hypothetical protein